MSFLTMLKMSSTALGKIPLSIPVFPFKVKVLPPFEGPNRITHAFSPSMKVLTAGLTTEA